MFQIFGTMHLSNFSYSRRVAESRLVCVGLKSLPLINEKIIDATQKVIEKNVNHMNYEKYLCMQYGSVRELFIQ